MAYLTLPVLIFFLGWFQIWVALPLAILLLIGATPLIAGRGTTVPFGTPWGIAVAALAVAIGWAALGGAGHFVYANTDWPIRDAVLRDLVVTGWPPAYGSVEDAQVIMRAPVAYYLPAAVAGKALGVQWADIALFVWTALGVWLFLLIALSRAHAARHVVILVLVVVFFSGMDVFGTDRYFLGGHDITDHLEWWAQVFQYSSNTTQLFWVPNHALPGWLVGALIYKHWRNPELLRIAPFAAAVTPLWSPLVTIGLAPFIAFIAVYHLQHKSWRSLLFSWPVIGALTAFIAAAYYLVLDSGTVRSGWTIALIKPLDLLAVQYVKFALLEFALVAAATALIRRDGLFAAAVTVLFVVPFYILGGGNDFAMRASIPALMVLCLQAADALADIDWSQRYKVALPLLACLSFGSITAIHEISRALLFTRWQPELRRNLIETARAAPPHYVARLNPLLSHAMREPKLVPGTSIGSRKQIR